MRSRALAVGDHHDRELAQQRVERLAEAQLVLALGRDAHAARARAHQDRRVVGRELAVDRRAVERALHAHAQQQLGRLGLRAAASVCTKHSIVAKFGEIIPAPLHWALEAHGPRRQRHLEVRALLEASVVWIACWKARVSGGVELRARREDALAASRRPAGGG